MRLGLLVYGSNTGLGIQTKAYYDHLNPHATLAVDISGLNKMKVNRSWYSGNVRWADGFPTNRDHEWLVDNSDVILVAETPLNYHLFKYARLRGVKTVLAYNYEMLDYFEHPTWEKPDIFAAPTFWNLDDMQMRFFGVRSLPVPTIVDGVSQKRLPEFRTFLHVAGRPAVADRNGTMVFLQAATLLKDSGLRFVVRIQDSEIGQEMKTAHPSVEFHMGDVENNDDLYADGDVLVLPRRFGGLCLPVNEALARGIPVIIPHCSPNDSQLPHEWLVPGEFSGDIWTRKKIPLFQVTVQDLATKMVQFSDMSNAQTVGDFARRLAEQRSWKVYKPAYEDLLEELCRK